VEQLYALTLAFLEMTFVMVGTGVLHSQRKVIGEAAFYVSLGLLFLFAQLICALDLRAALGGGLSFQLGATVLYLPYLAAMLIIYVADGTLAAQRLIIGSLVLFGLYFYLAEITRIECGWTGFSLTENITSGGMDFVMEESRRTMMATSLSHLLDFFLMPIIFTRLKNAGCGMFICVLGALSFTQIAEAIFYLVVLSWSDPSPKDFAIGSLIVRGVASIWLAYLISIYLKRIVTESDPQKRSPLDIIFAFFGGYGRSKMLERRIREWEGRYRQILRNASEIVVLLDGEGGILDANSAAARFFGADDPAALTGTLFFMYATLPDGSFAALQTEGSRQGSTPRHFDLRFQFPPGNVQKYLSCSLSLMPMQSGPVRVLIGRDVTEETRMAEEQQKLREQLAHAQRIESLGQLAGGIAHDFNNHLHAILGNVDLIQMAYAPENPDLARRLDKIAEIAEASGKLTSQLLGFARKGNYLIRTLDLRKVLQQSIDMLVPKSQADLEISIELPEKPCTVAGDAIQLQQIFVNLMLNAIDAMQNAGGRRRLEISAGEATAAPMTPNPGTAVEQEGHPVVSGKPENCYFAAVKDNGHGMDHDTMQRIFEPFFTTKAVGKGTGMGLAMVYGTVTSHHGWIQVESAPGKGTTFCVFLPKVQPDTAQKMNDEK